MKRRASQSLAWICSLLGALLTFSFYPSQVDAIPVSRGASCRARRLDRPQRPPAADCVDVRLAQGVRALARRDCPRDLAQGVQDPGPCVAGLPLSRWPAFGDPRPRTQLRPACPTHPLCLSFAVGLTDYEIRDLNDEINKLMREKKHWERQIVALGGANYTRNTAMLDEDGKQVPGTRGYKYDFGHRPQR